MIIKTPKTLIYTKFEINPQNIISCKIRVRKIYIKNLFYKNNLQVLFKYTMLERFLEE